MADLSHCDASITLVLKLHKKINNNYPKCIWHKFTNFKKDIGRMDKILKHGTTIYCLQKIYFKYDDIGRLKVKGCKKDACQH